MERSVIQAVLMLVLGNNVAILSDSLIKLVGSHDAPFQFAFMRIVSGLLVLVPLMVWLRKPLKPTQTRWHWVRAHVWLLSSLCMVLALTTLPLATANAVFYAAPLITVILAVCVFRERTSVMALTASALGLVGVVIIVNPTQVNGFALAALVVAFALAINNLLIKKLPAQHSVVETLYYTTLLALPLAAVGAWLEGATWSWAMAGLAFGSSMFVLIYAATCVFAYRAAQSNVISSAEYTGLIGAVVVGMVFFAEQPDLRFYLGTALIVVPLIILTIGQSKEPERKDLPT